MFQIGQIFIGELTISSLTQPMEIMSVEWILPHFGIKIETNLGV